MEKTIGELSIELIAHKNESDRRHNELFIAMKEIRVELENKVSHKMFMLVFVILSGVLGYMVWQISDIQSKTQITAEKVSAINGIMQKVDFKPEN